MIVSYQMILQLRDGVKKDMEIGGFLVICIFVLEEIKLTEIFITKPSHDSVGLLQGTRRRL